MQDVDYDAIRQEICDLCKTKLKLGTPVQEEDYKPYRSSNKEGSQVILRYSVPVELAGFKTDYSYPVICKLQYIGDSIIGLRRSQVDLGDNWAAQLPETGTAPQLGDILDSLLRDAQAGEQTHAEFCSDFCYDPDSKRAEAIYFACQATLTACRKAFGENLAKAQELANQL